MHVRPKTAKLLEENTGVSSLTLVLSIIFGIDTKSKNKQVDLHQTKKLIHSKGNHHKMIRQLTEWEKIVANHVCVKGLIFKNTGSGTNNIPFLLRNLYYKS